MTTTLRPPIPRATIDARGAPATDRSPSIDRPYLRAAGIAGIAGVVLSIVGSVFNQVVVDADVWAAMETSSATERAELLTEIAGSQTSYVVGYVIWMFAFPLCAVASALLLRSGRPSALAELVRPIVVGSIGTIMVVLTGFIGFVTVVAPAHAAGEDVLTIAHATGFLVSTADWVMSVVVLGVAPIVAVVVGRTTWAPRWLQALAGVTAAATALLVVALIVDERGLAFPIVPIGLALIGSAGVCALRAARA